MKTFLVQFGKQQYEVTVRRMDGETLSVVIDGEERAISVDDLGNRSFLLREGSSVEVFDHASRQDTVNLAYSGGFAEAQVFDQARLLALKATGGLGSGVQSISSAMPGMVVKVLVEEGQAVEAGDPVIIVEAMKMENVFKADGPGVVTKISAAEGDSVEGGAELVRIEEPADD